MKKITLLAAVIVVASFTSCKKAYTCSCSTVFTYSTGSPDTYKDDAKAYSKKMNKKTAQAACDEKKAAIDADYKNALTNNGTDPNPGVTTATTCDLK
jgi:hypothetical protein